MTALLTLTSPDSGYFRLGMISVSELVGAFQKQVKGVNFYELRLFVQDQTICFRRDCYFPLPTSEFFGEGAPLPHGSRLAFVANKLPPRLGDFLREIQMYFPEKSFQELKITLSQIAEWGQVVEVSCKY